eukprot:4503531-Amphidinium_carterae.1
MPPSEPMTTMRSRSRSLDRSVDRTPDINRSGGQPPPHPPSPGALPSQGQTPSMPHREASRSMSLSHPDSNITTRTRSHGASSGVDMHDQGDGRPPGPPPPNTAARGRAFTRQPRTRDSQFHPPAPSAVPPNHIDTMDVLDLMGLPVPEQHGQNEEMNSTSSRDTRSRSQRGPPEVGSTGVQPSDTTPRTLTVENEPLVTRPPTPASTIAYSPPRSTADDDADEFEPQLPLDQLVHPDDDDDDEDPAPPGAAAAAVTATAGSTSCKRSPSDSEEKGADSKKHRQDPEDGPFSMFLTVPTRLLTCPTIWHRSLTPQWSNMQLTSPIAAGSQIFPIGNAISRTKLTTLRATCLDDLARDPWHLLSTEAASLSLDVNVARFCDNTISDDWNLETQSNYVAMEVFYLPDEQISHCPKVLTDSEAMHSTSLHLQPSGTETLQYHGVIQKEFDTLTDLEMMEHAKDLQQSRLTEISKLFRLQCFRRIPRHSAQNLWDARR